MSAEPAFVDFPDWKLRKITKHKPPCAPRFFTLKEQRTLNIVVVNADRSDFVNIKPIWYPVPGLPDNTPPREE